MIQKVDVFSYYLFLLYTIEYLLQFMKHVYIIYIPACLQILAMLSVIIINA